MTKLPEGAEHQVELIVALNRFSDRLDSFTKPANNQTVTLSDGGSFWLWASATCCLIMLACLVVAVPVAVGAYLATQSQINQLQNTDNAIRAYINTGKMPPAPKDK